MTVRLFVPLIAAALVAVPALAEDGIVALSPAEKEAVLNQAAEREELPINGAPSRAPHGEVGIAVGSRGYRAMYGNTIVPLGGNATAGFSFYTEQMNGYRRRR